MHVEVIYASVSGTIAAHAAKLEKSLKAAGIAVTTTNAEDLAKPYKAPAGTLIYLTSTQHGGNHPDASQEYVRFLEGLQDGSQPLRALRYCVFGIGSKHFETFCTASLAVDKLLRELGAREIVPCISVDSNEETEATVRAWVAAVVDAVQRG